VVVLSYRSCFIFCVANLLCEKMSSGPQLGIPKWRDSAEDVFASLWRCGVAEFFACMIFIFIGCGSVTSSKEALGTNGISVPSVVAIALAHGFCIMVLVYSIGEISGGHINPAVTWAVLFTNKISVVRALVYWVSQFLGAIVGAGILYSILPPGSVFYLGCHMVNPHLSPGQGFWVEVVFTFIFIFIVFATAISPFAGKFAPLAGGDYGPGKLTPFAVGMTILILHLVGIPLTGASMNPARSFGPAVVRGDGCWANHWVYWIGPWIGSSLAALTAQMLFLSQPPQLYQVFKPQH